MVSTLHFRTYTSTVLTIIGFLSMALRRDHNPSGFLWWWCRLRHRTQTWRSLCLWHRSCESRFLWRLDASSGPETAFWCSFLHPHRCWVLKEEMPGQLVIFNWLSVFWNFKTCSIYSTVVILPSYSGKHMLRWAFFIFSVNTSFLLRKSTMEVVAK